MGSYQKNKNTDALISIQAYYENASLFFKTQQHGETYMKYMINITVVLFLLFFSGMSISWDGYDYGEGSYVEIDKGNLVREGENIEIYDYGTGEYSDVEVQSVTGSGGYGVEVEVYDYNTGEYRTLDMD